MKLMDSIMHIVQRQLISKPHFQGLPSRPVGITRQPNSLRKQIWNGQNMLNLLMSLLILQLYLRQLITISFVLMVRKINYVKTIPIIKIRVIGKLLQLRFMKRVMLDRAGQKKAVKKPIQLLMEVCRFQKMRLMILRNLLPNQIRIMLQLKIVLSYPILEIMGPVVLPKHLQRIFLPIIRMQKPMNSIPGQKKKQNTGWIKLENRRRLFMIMQLIMF